MTYDSLRRCPISPDGGEPWPRCPICPDGGEPWPRYKIRVHAMDDGSNDEANTTFAEFLFFDALVEKIVGITAYCVEAHKIGKTNYLPPELEQLPSKRFILTVVPQEVALNFDFYMFQVKVVEHLENEEPLAALPMLNTTAIPLSEPVDKDTSSEHDVEELLC